jgi:hypothetical protein
LVRHAESEYNPDHKHDSYGNIHLSPLGQQQAKALVSQLPQEDTVVVVSPLRRTLDTVFPYLIARYGEEITKTIEEKYLGLQKIYQSHRDDKSIQSFLLDTTQEHFHTLHDQVYVDFRITDVLVPELQDTFWEPHLTTSKPTSEKLTPE